MKRALFCSAVLASVSMLPAVQAAEIEWFVSPGLDDAEVLTDGDQLFGYFFTDPVAVQPEAVLVNGALFLRHNIVAAPPGLNFNGSYNNPEGLDLYQVAPNGANTGLQTILDSQTWGGAAALTITGLEPGQPYLVQYMISDDRANFRNLRNYDVSDSVVPEGSRDFENVYHSTAGNGPPGGVGLEAKIFSGFFVADPSGTQDIYNVLYENTNHTGNNSGSQVNAIQLRIIPEPASFSLLTLAGLGLAARRRSRRA